jgi:hypothetical protein
MGMLKSLNPVFRILPITQASFPEFVIDGHYYTSPNQQEEPPTISFSHSELVPDSPRQLRGNVWALHNCPYVPFVLFSPFYGAMTSRFATPPEIVKDIHGYHLPSDVAKSWKTLEQCCRQIATVLRSSFEQDYPKIFLNCSMPPFPTDIAYFKAHRP